MLEIVLAVPAALRLPLFRVSEFILTGPVRFLNELSFLAVPAALRCPLNKAPENSLAVPAALRQFY